MNRIQVRKDDLAVEEMGDYEGRSGELGEYTVAFDRQANKCVDMALLSGDPAGRIVVNDSATNPNAVLVSTSEGGVATDRSFHLALAC